MAEDTTNTYPIDFGTTEEEMTSVKQMARGYLGEIEKQAPLVLSGELEKDKFSMIVGEAVLSGVVPLDILRETLDKSGFGSASK